MRYEVETYKVSLGVAEQSEEVSTASGAAAVARSILQGFDADQEHFILLALDGQNRVYGFKHLFSGASTACHVYTKETLRAALLLGADAVIIAHNHPSGDATPSQNDLTLEKTLREGFKTIDLTLLDSLIIGTSRNWSSADYGWLSAPPSTW